LEILKLFWERRKDGVYAIAGMKGLNLLAQSRRGEDLFPIHDDLVVVDGSPFVGTIKSLMGESVVPVVANVSGESKLRCVGTGFFVSCTGLMITAAHVITDPIERKYGKITGQNDLTLQSSKLNFGVLVPNNPIFQTAGFSFYPFEWSLFLAEHRANPLPISGLDLKLTSDIAICKVPLRSGRLPHQPLTVVQSGIVGTGMRVGSAAYALGYAGMSDFDIELNEHGQPALMSALGQKRTCALQ